MSEQVKDTEAYDKLVKSRVGMLMQLPFYGTLLCNLDLEEREDIGTMATDGNKIYYAPSFVKEHTQQELAFVNAHEVMHVALGSLWRRGDRVARIWNFATDYAINGILMETCCSNPNQMVMPQGCLYDVKYKDMCAEQIYDILIKELNEQLQDDSNGDGSNGNSGDASSNSQGDNSRNGNSQNNSSKGGLTTLDNHELWDSQEAQENKEQKITEWQAKLSDAATRHAGNAPGSIKRYVKQLLEPKKDWKQELIEHIQEEVNDYSFNPPDRRYGELELFGRQFFLPDFNEMEDTAKDILFWIDTSGSISDDDLTVFYSEIVGAVNQFGGKLTGYIGFFDTVAYDPIPFDSIEDIKKIKPLGGGGTSFEAFLKKTNKLQESNTLNISSVVVFTDGYCSYPDKNPITMPLLWVMTTDSEAPFGRTTHMHV